MICNIYTHCFLGNSGEIYRKCVNLFYNLELSSYVFCKEAHDHIVERVKRVAPWFVFHKRHPRSVGLFAAYGIQELAYLDEFDEFSSVTVAVWAFAQIGQFQDVFVRGLPLEL